MVVGVHADSPDRVAILMLAPVGLGQSIKITDQTWTGSSFGTGSGSSSSDSHVTVTASSDWPVGHVVVKSMDLSSSGDDVLVYQGPQSSPTFICALEYKNGGFNPVPSGLTVGVNAIELSHRDNWVYNGAKSGAPARALRSCTALRRKLC